MAFTKTVTYAVATAGTHTLTLSDVDNLFVGDKVRVSGVSSTYNGTHTLTAVDTTNLKVSWTQGNQTHAGATVNGQLIVLVQWVADADVTAWLGIDSATTNDTAFIAECTEAGNEWAFTKRLQAGYTDRTALIPSPSVKSGTVMYAATLYRERGSVDSFASFDSMVAGGVPSMSLGRIMQLLGINRSQVA